MKISEIKKAYDTVSADEKLKEKVFSKLEAEETDKADFPIILETSQIKLEKKGGLKKAVTALCAAAAVFAAVIAGRAAFDRDPDIYRNPPAVSGTETPEITEIPPDTALVKVKVVDWNDGTFIKNMRVDYLPIIFNEDPDSPLNYYYYDMENMDKAGTIPITYEKSTEVLIPYGDYVFIVSTALPNEEYQIENITYNNDMQGYDLLNFTCESAGASSPMTVGKNTTEIVLTESKETAVYNSTYHYSKIGITLQDANGNPLPDYTVILQPADGKMAEGYSDEYGGYVLTRTNENGEAFWRSQTPVEGDYIVIAYKEELHPISEPILEPFVFDGDNTFSYTYRETVFITDKTFKEAKN